MYVYVLEKSIPVAARSMVWVCGRTHDGMWVRIPLGLGRLSLLSFVFYQVSAWMSTRAEESYRVWCVSAWSPGLDNEEVLAQ
jgi:hypothetical protein